MQTQMFTFKAVLYARTILATYIIDGAWRCILSTVILIDFDKRFLLDNEALLDVANVLVYDYAKFFVVSIAQMSLILIQRRRTRTVVCCNMQTRHF